MSNHQARHFYEFGPFRVDATERLLLRDGVPVPLTPKAFDTLMVLIENSGRLVEKDELMKRLWPDTFVEDANLAHNISLLRKAFSNGSDDHEYIQTVSRRGYRFVVSVRELQEEMPAASDHSSTVELEPGGAQQQVLASDGQMQATMGSAGSAGTFAPLQSSPDEQPSEGRGNHCSSHHRGNISNNSVPEIQSGHAALEGGSLHKLCRL